MLFPCFFHPFCRSHTSTAFSFLHCKGQLSKPWLDILLYQDKKKFKKQMNHWDRKKIPKGIIKTLLKKEWKCRELLEESMLPEERKWCAFSTIIPYFFNWWQNLLMVKTSGNVKKVGISMYFLCFWMEEINWWEVSTESLLSTVFPYFFKVLSNFILLFVSLTT